MLNRLTLKMIEYYHGDPKRIQHFIKVREFARLIAAEENIDEKTRFVIEAAGLVHDIGIRSAERVYGECGGKLQEKLGPPLARGMMAELGFSTEVIDRVCYLIAHHHTYTDIDGIDLQILIEADFLVNLCEDSVSKEGVSSAYASYFKTQSGKMLCREMFDISG